MFIIQGDVSSVVCDAWLLPTDQKFSVTESFIGALSDDGKQRVKTLVDTAPSGWKDRGCFYFETHPLPGGPQIWLGDIGRKDRIDYDHYAKRAREFIQEASHDVAERHSIKTRRVRLAMPVLGTGHGGVRATRGSLLGKLIPVLVECAAEFDCDVVLVTFDEVMYTAAQKVRREAKTITGDLWSGLSPSLRKEADRLASLARKGELVVFMGAGVSLEAGVPLWGDLLQSIAKSKGMQPEEIQELKKLDQRDQATVISNGMEEKFLKTVYEEVDRKQYSLLHGLLSSLPVSEFITTNFDQLFETAAQTNERKMSVVTKDRIRHGDRWLLKLHGDKGEDLVLTREGYIGALQMHAPLRGLVQSLLLMKHMLFVGYSLSDEDFYHLVHELRGALKSKSLPENGSTSDTDGERIGTVLALRRSPFMEELWPELDFIHAESTDASPTSPIDHEEAARVLTIFLDMVGCLSASDVRFVLDESMGSLTSDQEMKLASLLVEMEQLISSSPSNGDDWQEIRRFLDRFRFE